MFPCRKLYLISIFFSLLFSKGLKSSFWALEAVHACTFILFIRRKYICGTCFGCPECCYNDPPLNNADYEILAVQYLIFCKYVCCSRYVDCFSFSLFKLWSHIYAAWINGTQNSEFQICITTLIGTVECIQKDCRKIKED